MINYSILFKPTNTVYEVMPNIKVVQKHSTELDMYEFTLSTIYEEIDFDFKKYNGLIPIEFRIDNNGDIERINLYITYYNKRVVNYEDNGLKYVIQATTPLFYLQRIVLPNRLITQPIEGKKKTIYEELEKIILVYAHEISLDSRLKQLLDKPCPELQFTKSTLYEVVCALFGIAGLFPKMESSFYVLSFSKISGSYTYWQPTIFSRIETSNTAANYSDMLDVDIENAISKNEDISTTWIAPTSEEAGLTTENYFWQLPSNIYELIHVDLFSPDIKYSYTDINSGVTATENLSYPVSIGYWTVSKAIYDTLKPSPSLQVLRGREYKRNYLYYENNRISGGAYNDKTWFGGDLEPAIKNIIRLTLEYYLENMGRVLLSFEVPDVREVMLRVTYKSENDNTRVKIVKDGVNKPTNALITNQEDSYIDTINFGNQKKELINRMGNEETLAQARWHYDTDHTFLKSPQVGDNIYGNYIIAERECMLKENIMLVNFTLSKEYSFTTGFSGLNQVKRFTQIDKENTLIRNDNFLYNFEVSTTNKFSTNYLIERLVNKYGSNTLGLCLHYFRARLNNDVPESEMILLTSQNKHVADSIVCQMGFNDNYIAGNSVTYEDKHAIMNPVKYTNDRGEFRMARIFFGAGEEQRYETNYDIISRYPLAFFGASTDRRYDDHILFKDTREISNFTYQFRVKGSDNVFVYDKFLDYTNLTSHPNEELKAYILGVAGGTIEDLPEIYDKNTTIPLGDLAIRTITFENTTITIKNIFSDYGAYAIGVTDSKGNLLLGINILHEDTNNDLTLYVNEL